MTQLREEGWIHHLARHAVACFLTRGDLWQHWEEGAKVFDLYLLDADWAINNGNWQWLSCSNFFYQYFRCYSPVAFGKKTDPNGDYIRKWLPVLKEFPKKYIYEPWTAPISLQRSCGCIVGQDYPERIVVHEVASKENMAKMKIAYEGRGKDVDTTTDAAVTGAPPTKLAKDIGVTAMKKKQNNKDSDKEGRKMTSYFAAARTHNANSNSSGNNKKRKREQGDSDTSSS